MSILCKIGLHNWKYSQELNGDSPYVPVETSENPLFRICKKCHRKEYITIGIRKRFLKRNPTKSDIRMLKVDEILNK